MLACVCASSAARGRGSMPCARKRLKAEGEPTYERQGGEETARAEREPRGGAGRRLDVAGPAHHGWVPERAEEEGHEDREGEERGLDAETDAISGPARLNLKRPPPVASHHRGSRRGGVPDRAPR